MNAPEGVLAEKRPSRAAHQLLNLQPACPAWLTARAGSKKSPGANLQENFNERRIKLFSSGAFNLLQC